MSENILKRIKSLGLDEYWDDIEETLKNHKPGPSNLIEAAFKSISKNMKDLVAAQSAVALFQVSAIIMDDIADEDTKGIYLKIGVGRACNLAIALCNGSYRLILESGLSESDKDRCIKIINEIYDTHAKVIELECKGFDDEKLYWQVVSGKSGQVCGNALKLGATLAEANDAMSENLYKIGSAMGEIGQVCNDFAGAFKNPANTDWQRHGSNLLLLYAMSDQNPNREGFIEISKDVFKGESELKNAQQSLIDDGAVSHAGKAITDRLMLMADLSLKIQDGGNPNLAAFFTAEISQALKWLEKRKITIPNQLLSQVEKLSKNH